MVRPIFQREQGWRGHGGDLHNITSKPRPRGWPKAPRAPLPACSVPLLACALGGPWETARLAALNEP